MKKLFLLLTLYSILHTSYSYSQVVYEPIHRDIYEFLGRLSQKGVIEFDDNIRPLSRNYIAENLLILGRRAKYSGDMVFPLRPLPDLEYAEWGFYVKEFANEISVLKQKGLDSSFEYDKLINDIDKKTGTYYKANFANSNSGRWRLFNYQDDLFTVNVSPIIGYQRGFKDSKSNSHLWSGIYLFGYINNSIGFSFDLRDNSESGEIDTLKNFTPETGYVFGYNTRDSNKKIKSIEYSEVRTHLTYSWDWGHIAAGKEFLEWGYGESGKLVLSEKAPSFPFIKYDIKPVKWLRFNYIHAWLSSDVVDSNEIYKTNSKLAGEYRILYKEKYFASHTLTVSPYHGLDIFLGESIIYSDRFEPIYLFPLMFFRAADHYLSSQNNSAGGNSQFFLGVSSRNHIKNTHLYGSAFIDEIRTTTLSDPAQAKNQSGFTLGGSVVDLPINNLKITAEYTKIYPFVYMHYIPTQTYSNASYNMGHWIGSNADLIYGSLNYRILRGLQATAWAEYIRKGEDGTADQQYTLPQPPFLFGLRKNYTYAGLEVKYEFMHELFLRGRYQYSSIEEQQPDQSYMKNSYNEFYIAVYYGL